MPLISDSDGCTADGSLNDRADPPNLRGRRSRRHHQLSHTERADLPLPSVQVKELRLPLLRAEVRAFPEPQNHARLRIITHRSEGARPRRYAGQPPDERSTASRGAA